MSYVGEFRSRLQTREYNKVLALWQEYCENDQIDPDELIEIFTLIKQSDFQKTFGQYVEAILPLVLNIKNEDTRIEVLRHIYDLQTTNSQTLWDLVHEIILKHYGTVPKLQEKLKLVGLRTKDNFQGALSNFLLLNHIMKDNFVFHPAGWGVGKIVDSSFLREQITVEFENLGGCKRDISFKNAFKSLLPLPNNHFYVERFVHPEKLEELSKKDPLALILHLLQGTGPKTASDIKELLEDYVIEKESYSKWWQGLRSRLKKDDLIEVPENPKEPYKVRKALMKLDDRIDAALLGKVGFSQIFGALYSLIRDFPSLCKTAETLQALEKKIQELHSMKGLRQSQKLELFFLQELLGKHEPLEEPILHLNHIDTIISEIEVVAFRKRLLVAIKEYRKDWAEIFGNIFLTVDPAQLRDYIVKELSDPEHLSLLTSKIEKLIFHPVSHPEAFLWTFQKVLDGEISFMTSQRDKERLFESFFLLLNILENKEEQKAFVRKMYVFITKNRFQIVRDLLKGTESDFAQEFLLLASKCHTFSSHDKKILRSLVDVVHEPSKAKSPEESYIIWTTEAGYHKLKDKIQHIGTVQIVQNAKEVEAARAHGDLRENAEYKSALERRSHLQHELKTLSDQFNKAQILIPKDIDTTIVSVGTTVSLKDTKGKKSSITILGPWDANPDENILSFQSKLAQSMLGKTVGDTFDMKGETVTIASIQSAV